MSDLSILIYKVGAAGQPAVEWAETSSRFPLQWLAWGVWEDLVTVCREGKDPGMEGHGPDQETPRTPQHGTRGALFEQY